MLCPYGNLPLKVRSIKQPFYSATVIIFFSNFLFFRKYIAEIFTIPKFALTLKISDFLSMMSFFDCTAYLILAPICSSREEMSGLVISKSDVIFSPGPSRSLDNAIHWINLYPIDNAIDFPNIYPMDSAIHRLNNQAHIK